MVTTSEHIEALVHYYVNKVRSKHGLLELEYDHDLVEIARSHSSDMIERDFFSHTTPEGNDVKDRYRKYGYQSGQIGTIYMGENIAQQSFPKQRVDQSSEVNRSKMLLEIARSVVDQWLDSPGHRKNILSTKWECEGIGAQIKTWASPPRLYVTQNFSGNG